MKKYASKFVDNVISTAVIVLSNLHHFNPDKEIKEFIIDIFRSGGVIPSVIGLSCPIVPLLHDKELFTSSSEETPLESDELPLKSKEAPPEIQIADFSISDLTEVSLPEKASRIFDKLSSELDKKQKNRLVTFLLNRLIVGINMNNGTIPEPAKKTKKCVELERSHSSEEIDILLTTEKARLNKMTLQELVAEIVYGAKTPEGNQNPEYITSSEI
jgi:hypothetical protein